MKSRESQLGLTLIELIVVLSILTLMAGLVMPVLDNFREFDGVRRQKLQFQDLKKAYEGWVRDLLAKKLDENIWLVNPPPLEFAGSDTNDFCLIKESVLTGAPGYSYLSHWFEDEIDHGVAGGPYFYKDVWGNKLTFASSSVFNTKLTSGGPDPSPSHQGDDVMLLLDRRVAQMSDRRQRAEVFNAMFEVYNRRVRPSLPVNQRPVEDELTQYVDGLKGLGLLNSDLRWVAPPSGQRSGIEDAFDESAFDYLTIVAKTPSF